MYEINFIRMSLNKVIIEVRNIFFPANEVWAFRSHPQTRFGVYRNRPVRSSVCPSTCSEIKKLTLTVIFQAKVIGFHITHVYPLRKDLSIGTKNFDVATLTLTFAELFKIKNLGHNF